MSFRSEYVYKNSILLTIFTVNPNLEKQVSVEEIIYISCVYFARNALYERIILGKKSENSSDLTQRLINHNDGLE